MAEEKKVPNSMEQVTDIKEITLPLMQKYIVTQSASDIEWLLNALKEKVPNGVDKNGNPKTKKRSFIEIRNEFTRRYFPARAPKGTMKGKESAVDKAIAELEKALAEKKG